MKVKIVSDSSCDIWSMDGIDFESAPLTISTEERTYRDDETLDIPEMMAYLSQYKNRSYTACPGTGDWLKAFGDADEIYVTTLTSSLSGSYNSAMAAAGMYQEEHPDAKILVIDTLSTSAEMVLIMEKIAELKQKGCSFEEVSDQITKYRESTRLFFVLQSLHNLAQNGRIPKLLAKTIGILGISIIGTASEKGTIEPISKSRGKKALVSNMMEQLIKAGYHGGRVYIAHAENPELAQELEKAVKKAYPHAVTKVYPVRGLCAFYAELGGLIIGCEC